MSMAMFPHLSSTGVAGKPILSIRTRLVILALLAVVPLMFDRVRLMQASRGERISVAAREVLDLAKRGAQSQREIMTTVRAALKISARAYLATPERGKACDVFMRDLAADMPWIKGLSVVGADGRITCSTTPLALGLSMADRPYYRKTLRIKDFVVSDYVIGRITRTPAIIALYPVQAIDSSVNTLIVASVDLQWISSVIGSVAHRPGSTVLLVDDNGTVLAGDPSVAGSLGAKISKTPLMKAISSADQGTARVEGLDGVRRVFGFVHVPSSNARLVVGLNEAEVLRRIDRDILIAYLQLGFFGLLVFLLAWFGGERLIVAPIRSLARMATRIGRGDLSARPEGNVWVKEFEPLATALNDMAARLADREADLRAANRHLEQLAMIDPLSGLANRRGFDARLAADWQRAAKFSRPVGLLMIDVDHFKLFNDRYGHLEGDVCLRRVAELLNEAASGTDDLPARYGGEEFALLLPGVDIGEAQAIAERLRQAVENLCITHATCPAGQVTISVGVASLVPMAGQDAAALIEAADAGLYAAKRRGRNAVVADDSIVAAGPQLIGESPPLGPLIHAD
jgi:diguanylate cyclase (GGDEF)-like protein